MWKIETSAWNAMGPQHKVLDYVLFRLLAHDGVDVQVAKIASLGGKLSSRIDEEGFFQIHTVEFDNHADYVQFLLEHGG